jgi:hypothetical protein
MSSTSVPPNPDPGSSPNPSPLNIPHWGEVHASDLANHRAVFTAFNQGTDPLEADAQGRIPRERVVPVNLLTGTASETERAVLVIPELQGLVSSREGRK